MTKELLKLCEFSPKNKWKLLYRASRDDFTPEAFHAKCDYYSNTLTIVKSSCGNIFGGYAQIEWNPNIYGNHDKEAFIFSLINDKRQKEADKDKEQRLRVRCTLFIECWACLRTRLGFGTFALDSFVIFVLFIFGC